MGVTRTVFITTFIMSVYPAMYVYMLGASQVSASKPLELELQKTGSSHVSARN